ncbi:MAG TPA: cytochrome c oxidase subunit 3 [bacterium]|nr:cytochrome c oxidase subunit 3 [bacterium]
MSTNLSVVTTNLLKPRPAAGRGGTSIRPSGPIGYGRGGRGGEPGPAGPAVSSAVIGIAAALAAVAMLFVAFTIAYLARRQEPGWGTVAMPPVLWLTTAILLSSSGTLEWARRRIAAGDIRGLQRGLAATAWLGVAFLLGQLAAWRSLAAQGAYISANPHSGFFYLLTGAHGAHLLGGLVALGIIVWKAYAGRYGVASHAGVGVFALYWHFMDLLWLYLFALLFWA